VSSVVALNITNISGVRKTPEQLNIIYNLGVRIEAEKKLIKQIQEKLYGSAPLEVEHRKKNSPVRPQENAKQRADRLKLEIKNIIEPPDGFRRHYYDGENLLPEWANAVEKKQAELATLNPKAKKGEKVPA
jgi:hypothetical protein